MAYHVRAIPRGVLGEFSKVQEEWEELMDARDQSARILELCEISDLIGALNSYLNKQYNLSIEDAIHMAEMTRQAFEEGHRK